MKAETLLDVRDLKISRGGNMILDISHFELAKGEVLSLIGPNGAGKTTLLGAMAFLIKPSSGEILFRGGKIFGSKSVLAYRRKIAMVFQEPLLFKGSVFYNVASGLKFRNMDKAEILEKVRYQLNRFGIEHLRERAAATLSGGEAQRTSLARAFATEPEVLFLDEPFSSLDPPTREILIGDLEKALHATGTTAVLATHDRIEALRLSNRIGVMHRGRLIQLAAPEEIMNRPADELVAAFVGTDNILTGRLVEKNGGTCLILVDGHQLEAVGAGQVGDEVFLFIRPENIALSLQPEKTSARNQHPGVIQKIIPEGLSYKIRIDCGFILTAFVTSHSVDELSLRENMKIYASFKATAIHMITKGS